MDDTPSAPTVSTIGLPASLCLNNNTLGTSLAPLNLQHVSLSIFVIIVLGWALSPLSFPYLYNKGRDKWKGSSTNDYSSKILGDTCCRLIPCSLFVIRTREWPNNKIMTVIAGQPCVCLFIGSVANKQHKARLSHSLLLRAVAPLKEQHSTTCGSGFVFISLIGRSFPAVIH